MSREIITLQIGNYSNYIGSHFWNIQESNFVYNENNKSELNSIDLNHDILFREGVTSKREITYTPRLILVDFKDNLNALKETGNLLENDVEEQLAAASLSAWSGQIDRHQKPQNQKSEYIKELETEQAKIDKRMKIYINMDEQVNYWSDYLRPRLHHRSILLLNSEFNANTNVEPFDLYNYGLQANKEANFLDDYENRLRLYAEECDNIQGFHFFVDAFNGFGGLCKEFLSLINEEYTKKPILSIFSYPKSTKHDYESQMIKVINSAFTFRTFFTEVDQSIVLPLSLFNVLSVNKEEAHLNLNPLDYKPNLDYHTSAIIASLFDCLSTPWRQKSQHTSLNDIYSAFDIFSEKIATLQAIIPLQLEHDKYLFNYLQENSLIDKSKYFTPLWSDASTHINTQASDINVQIACCKGVEDDRVKNPNDTCLFSGVVPASKVLEAYCKEVFENANSLSYSMRKPLNTSIPYPDILRSTPFGTGQNMALLTQLQMNKNIKYMIESMCVNLEKCDIKHFSRYFDAGMEQDDFTELTNFNRELHTLYSS